MEMNREIQNQSNLKEQFLSMPLLDHLDELRSRLIKSLFIITIAFFVSYTFRNFLLKFIKAPLFKILPPEQQFLYFTGILDELMITLKISLYSAIAISMPYILFQLWGFISPGLRENEKKFAAPFILISTFFFIIGMAFAYYIVFPYGFKLLLSFGNSDKSILTIKEYFSLTTKLMFMFGLVFELPMILGFFAWLGLLTKETLRKYRRYSILIIAIASAVLTPTQDAITMGAMALLLWLLYEASIFVVAFIEGKRQYSSP